MAGGEQVMHKTGCSSATCAALALMLLSLAMPGTNAAARDISSEAFINAMIQHAKALEKRILFEGRPLTADELALARAANIKHPDRVRILVLPSIPVPQSAYLRAKLDELDLLQLIRLARGTTKGYGIIVTHSGSRRRKVIAHELVHVGQYEQLGGIAALMRHHLPDLISNGYRRSTIESEAYRLATQIASVMVARK